MAIIPPVPTDNLYKFLALFGLVIVVACMAGMLSGLDLIENEADRVVSLSAALSRESTTFHQIIDDGKKDPNLTRNTIAVAESVSHALARLASDHELSRFALNTRIARERSRNEIYYFGLYVGAALSFVGFSLWYVKLQKYQDQIVRMQAEDLLESRKLRTAEGTAHQV